MLIENNCYLSRKFRNNELISARSRDMFCKISVAFLKRERDILHRSIVSNSENVCELIVASKETLYLGI